MVALECGTVFAVSIRQQLVSDTTPELHTASDTQALSEDAHDYTTTRYTPQHHSANGQRSGTLCGLCTLSSRKQRTTPPTHCHNRHVPTLPIEGRILASFKHCLNWREVYSAPRSEWKIARRLIRLFRFAILIASQIRSVR